VLIRSRKVARRCSISITPQELRRSQTHQLGCSSGTGSRGGSCRGRPGAVGSPRSRSTLSLAFGVLGFPIRLPIRRESDNRHSPHSARTASDDCHAKLNHAQIRTGGTALNLDIRDPALLGTVRPRNVEAYLRSAGWQKTFVDPGVVSIWTLRGIPDDHELRLPLDVDASGYAQRVKEILEELEAAEQRSQLRVFLDVQDWNCDAIRFGYRSHADLDYPTLANSIDTLQNAQEILTALACSVTDPQPWFGKRRPKEAIDYAASLEVSPFEEPLSVRILGRVEPSLFAGEEDDFVPLTRRVSLKLRDAFQHLATLVNGSARNTDNDWLASSLQYGLSANVTESLASLLRLPSAFGPGVEVSLRLAALRSFSGQALSVWHFRRSHLQALVEIGERLKTFAAAPDEQLLFLVADVRISKRSRIITGTALIADEARRIEMTVDDELIRIAELAKSRNNAVKCFGRLRRRPDSGRYEVLQPHDFQIVHSEDATVEVLRRRMPMGKAPGSSQLPLIREQP